MRVVRVGVRPEGGELRVGRERGRAGGRRGGGGGRGGGGRGGEGVVRGQHAVGAELRPALAAAARSAGSSARVLPRWIRTNFISFWLTLTPVLIR